MPGIAEDLTQVVIEHIRQQIFESKTLTPGDKINERELSRVLNISRAPIREAFRELEEQGFITSVKYKGWSVPEFSEEEALEINSIRTLLELYLFETAVETRSYDEEDLRVAEGLNRELERIDGEPEAAGKVYRFLEKEMEFHLSLYGIAKSHCLLAQKLLKNLSYQVRLSLSYIDNLHKQGFMAYSVKIHALMLEHLRQRDIGGIRTILTRRLDKNKDIRSLLK